MIRITQEDNTLFYRQESDITTKTIYMYIVNIYSCKTVFYTGNVVSSNYKPPNSSLNNLRDITQRFENYLFFMHTILRYNSKEILILRSISALEIQLISWASSQFLCIPMRDKSQKFEIWAPAHLYAYDAYTHLNMCQ